MPRLLSPLDFGYSTRAELGAAAAPGGEVLKLWGHRPGFGGYLKRLRVEAGLTLRAAGAEIGMSHSNLARLENSPDEIGPIDFGVLDRIAATYRRDPREVHHEHGYRYVVVEDPPPTGIDEAEAFEAIALSKELKPPGLRKGALEALHPHLKRQLMALLRRLAAHEDPEGLLAGILTNAQGQAEDQ